MKQRWKAVSVGAGLALVTLRACSMSGGPISGVVIEEETGKPVGSAIVIASWKGSWWGAPYSQQTCYHIDTVRADAAGNFRINGWGLLINERQVSMEAFRPGFMRPHGAISIGEKVFLSPSTRSKEEYFEYLRTLLRTNSCWSGGESQKNLYRLYAAVIEEAELVAETPEQKERLNDLRNQRDRLLVNQSKPVEETSDGELVNVNPADNYRKEDLLKW